MGTLIIGSTALKYHFPEWARSPKDLDAFSNEWRSDPGEDIFWDERFADWIPAGTWRYATRDELLTIKLSHAGWDLKPRGSWEKHQQDVVDLQEFGAEVDEDLYAMLYSVWQDKHGKKPIMLSDDKSEFFDDAVKRRFDHDSLHRSVAYGERPLYEDYLKPGATVEMDMAKVWAAGLSQQIKLFREEIYVTALERMIIPTRYSASPRAAYAWALRRTVTGLTKGRSSRFIAENYDTFRVPDLDYVNHHISKAHLLEEL